jgi:malonyl-CoA O-methyltransferase
MRDRGIPAVSSDLAIDKREVKRAFERAASGYDAAAILQHEVCRRMLERLGYIRIAPAAILDAGAGTGNAIPGLIARHPGVPLVALDIAVAMLERARVRLRWWQNIPGLRPPLFAVAADLERLPLASASIGLVWSNLALQWVNDLPATLKELHRVLEPGGLLMFSTFGPDTLKELRASYQGVDTRTHVSRFVDMHDIGDMLVHGGFADPVMDMEPFTLTYDDVRGLMRDLKSIGAHNATHGRPSALTAKSTMKAVAASYERFRSSGKLPATFEVVYGHAWKPLARVSPTGKRVIDIKAA